MGEAGRFGETRPEAVVEVLRAQAERAVDVRAELADIVGEAESDDGVVKAIVGPKGLQELVLEPKAMRMPSTDLATTVVDVTQRAREDFDTRRADKTAELGASTRPSLEESLAHLDRLNSLVNAGHGDMRTVFERFRSETGR